MTVPNPDLKPEPEDRSSADRAQAAEEGETGLRTEGQRRINLIWEITQSLVALAVTIATLIVAARLALSEDGAQSAFLLLSNVFFLVLGTYFNRTNHVRVGGVSKEQRGR